ncbi:hypothetical protein [Allomuricauda sp. F6463D]|uniref:hypothetical protein n=1 Tax=Allomuricauda sp. F6463D TaxID=2926409 RepID=UPI001FF66087|nr:hypothetical protein [Muricauda sp. F6463D]MCK0159883.1 hypothetical protein [Muricauda sp. F6463D]
MRNCLFIIFLLTILPMVSCGDSKKQKDDSAMGTEDFHNVSIDGNYQIDIPKFMTGTTGLNEEASLQFQSLLQEAYLLIIDEPKSEFEEVYRGLEQYDDELSVLQNYRDARLQILSRTTQMNRKSTPIPTRINGLDAETLQIDANIKGIDNEISYFITFIEGDHNVYMIMAWTLKGKKLAHQNTFNRIAKSFEMISEPY